MRGPSERKESPRFCWEDQDHSPQGGWGSVWNSGPPRGLGVGDGGRQETFPHTLAAPKQRWGNNNAGAQESQTQDGLGLGGGGRGGDTTRATYFLEGG